MRSRVVATMAGISAILLVCAAAWADDPIKWSAPMSHYPNQWSPTPEPPNYFNPYGYRYPYYGYGYGYGHGGHAYYGYGSGGYMQGQQNAVGQNFSGNPYHYYYGGQ
ncbi:MAG: hypothetical protein RDU20_13055 [Desulfomonilaceae bacterium]|nr:hypothetical protein [Desulfomonilaceae bacterium]